LIGCDTRTSIEIAVACFLFPPPTSFFATAKIYDSLQSGKGVAAKEGGCERARCKVNRTSFV